MVSRDAIPVILPMIPFPWDREQSFYPWYIVNRIIVSPVVRNLADCAMVSCSKCTKNTGDMYLERKEITYGDDDITHFTFHERCTQQKLPNI